MKENVLERNARMDTDRKIADFRVKQQMDYAFKMKYARIRAWESKRAEIMPWPVELTVGGLYALRSGRLYRVEGREDRGAEG